MTFLELVHALIPDLTDLEADSLLWERTPFPCLTRPADLEPYLLAAHGDIVARSTHLGALP